MNERTEAQLIDCEHEQVHKIKDGCIKKSKAWKYCSKSYSKQLFHRLERLPANLVTYVENENEIRVKMFTPGEP